MASLTQYFIWTEGHIKDAFALAKRLSTAIGWKWGLEDGA